MVSALAQQFGGNTSYIHPQTIFSVRLQRFRIKIKGAERNDTLSSSSLGQIRIVICLTEKYIRLFELLIIYQRGHIVDEKFESDETIIIKQLFVPTAHVVRFMRVLEQALEELEDFLIDSFIFSIG